MASNWRPAPRVMTSDNLLILLDIQAAATRISFIKAGILAVIYLSSKALYFKQDLGGMEDTDTDLDMCGGGGEVEERRGEVYRAR